MKGISRLAGIALALILLGLSPVAAPAHVDSNPNAKEFASVTITRIDDKESVHPGTTLKFTVIVERLGAHVIDNATLAGPDGDDDVSTPFTLNDTMPYASYDVEYTVTADDLGADTVRRIVPLTWTLKFNATHADGSTQHDSLEVANSIEVYVTKDPGTGAGASDVSVDLAVVEPVPLAAGKTIEFYVTLATGKYGFGTGDDNTGDKSLVLRRQVYNLAGNKAGGAVGIAVFQLPALQSYAVSLSAKKTYNFLKTDLEGAKVEFFYELDVTAADLVGEPDNFTTDKIGGSYVLNLIPTPHPTIGTTAAATVTGAAGNRVIVALANGAKFSLSVGWLGADGVSRSYNKDGYIREVGQGRGQTYAVVRRDVDGSVVRVWIPADSRYVNDVPWVEVLAHRTFPTAVVEAIPLDEMYPVNNQLVRNSGDDRIYVYLGAKWRHVPDIATFQARGFFWCDVTAADAGFFERVTTGSPLPRSGTPEDPDYPSCR